MRRTLRNACTALLLAGSLPATAGQLELVSKVAPRRASDTASGESRGSSLSADGRFFVFLSNASNLVRKQIDENRGDDVFLHDRITGTTTLVSRTADSSVTAGNHPSELAVISADGRYVAFTSRANDLVAGEDDTDRSDVFLYDRITGATALVSRSKASSRVPGNGQSDSPVLSADGRYVAFVSSASDLVDEETDNRARDVFLYDRRSGKVTLVSRSAASPRRPGDKRSGLPSLSADGRYVAFESEAENLGAGPRNGRSPFVNVFVYDRVTGRNLLASHASHSPAAAGIGRAPVISANGEHVAYLSASDHLVAGQSETDFEQVFLFHRPSGRMTLVSHASGSLTQTADEASFTFAVSADGSYVAFMSYARDLVGRQADSERDFDVFLWEKASGGIRLVSRSLESPVTEGSSDSILGGLSADGGQVVFRSDSIDIVDPAEIAFPSSSEIYLYDRRSRENTLVSYADGPGGSAGSPGSQDPLLSADGNWVAFSTHSTNLAGGNRDLNGASDVYLYGRTTEKHELVSRRDRARPSVTPLADSEAGDLSEDGRYAVFTSASSDLVPRLRDSNEKIDVFLYDHTLATTTLVSRSAASPLQTGNAASGLPRISADGRFVVYLSAATDLIPGQIESDPGDERLSDVFLYDRVTGTTTLVSRSAASPVTATGRVDFAEISADGSTIGFMSNSPDLLPGFPSSSLRNHVFLYDRASGVLTLASHSVTSATVPADDDSYGVALSADGRIAVFGSDASNLVSGLPSPPPRDLFQPPLYFYDRSSGSATLVTRGAGPVPSLEGGGAFRISANGRFIVFRSWSGNLVPDQIDEGSTLDLFLYDRITGTTQLVSHAPGSPALADGAGDELPVISADGSFVIFMADGSKAPGYSGSPHRRHILLFERSSGTNRLLTKADADGDSGKPAISADGRYIAFVSEAKNLSPEPVQTIRATSNVFLQDRTTGKTTLVSRSGVSPFLSGNGSSAGGLDESGEVFLSASGSLLLFDSLANNLVPGDLNNHGGFLRDVFLYTHSSP